MDTAVENTCQQFTLKSGRRLGFAEYGHPDGLPLFYFHGWPSSRLEAGVLNTLCTAMRIRLLAPDRPGYGLSEFQRRRTLLNWPRDVSELADRLGLSRFGVLGVSGGGPYALACAAVVAERLSAVLLVGSVGPADSPESTEGMVPLNRWLLKFARKAPWIAESVGGLLLRAVWRNGQQVIPAQVERRLPEPDKIALQRPELRQTLIASSVEALRHGVRGAAADGLLLAQPWGFRLEEIRVPVHLWHGERDVVVPAGMGRCLARRLPHCHAKFSPEDGHFSLPYNRAAMILDRVKGE